MRRRTFLLAVLSTLAVSASLQAQHVQYQTVTRWEQRCENGKCTIVPVQVQVPVTVEKKPATITTGDPLVQVNNRRANSGLRPYLRDEGLTQAAHAVATFRARHGIIGHTNNDFAFLPAGTQVLAVGCGAHPPDMGFLSCAMYDHATYAGAATVIGSDGRAYHHLYIANAPSAPVAAKAGCDCGPGCKCEPGTCPGACPKPTDRKSVV